MSSSLQNPNNPLIVLDEAAMGDDFPLSSISVDDIEEISVLQDASIYGVREANGTVLINTRR